MFKRVFIIFLIVFILIGAGIFGYITYNKIQLRNHYNEMMAEGNKECSEVFDKISNMLVVIEVGEKKVIKRYSDFVAVEVTVDFPEMENSYDESYSINIVRNVRTSALYDSIESLYEEPVNAYISHTLDDGWVLIEQSDSYYFNIDSAYQYVDLGLSNGEIYFSLDSLLMSANITVGDLVGDYEKVSWLNDFQIRYCGIVYLTGEDLAEYLSGYDIDIESVDFTSLRKSLKTSYETFGKTVDFTTTNGNVVSVEYVTFGKSLNWDKEKKDIISAIENHESLNKDNPYLYGYDDILSEYVEVSIQDQHVWHYINGKLCCDTDCVTGTKGIHDTPIGVYYVSECINGKYLIGDDYKTWVDKWMRLTNSGVGLHDASWRSSFGGNIYKTNGSHGCINLPKKYAYNLFSEMHNGVTVIIY